MRRLAPATAIAVLLLTSLSGCFLIPQAPQPEAGSGGAAANGFGNIGDCWEAKYADLAEWSSWEGDGPVDCNENHQSYTFFVGELETEVTSAWQDGSLTDELATAISDECAPHLLDLGVPDSAARAGGYFFVAPEKEWENGDHRIRCDVAVSALDSDWSKPKLEKLPADINDLVADIDKNSRSYELCLMGDGYGPYDSTEAYYMDCATGDYYWRYAGEVEYPSDAPDPYPTPESFSAFAEIDCAALGLRADETVLPYFPSQEMWDSGYRAVTCWFSLVEAPSKPV